MDSATGNRDQENGELSITGRSSIYQSTTSKHSLKVEFTKKTTSNLEGVMNFAAPPFPGSPLQKLRVLMFRNPTQDSWVLHGDPPLRDFATYIKDAWCRTTHTMMGHFIAQRRWVHLYVDGLYWGVYEMTERVNEDTMRAYDVMTLLLVNGM